MKLNIIENKERKTITVVLGEVRFYSAKYLLERYDDSRYFGNGILKITNNELKELLKKVSASLNLANPDVKVSPKLLFEGEGVDYPLFQRHFNQDDEWDGSYEVRLSAFSEKKERYLFFNDLAKTSPVTDEDIVKKHEWGVELELASRVDEDTLETKIFVILHRIVKGKKVETLFQTNDDAWGGFDLDDEEESDDFVEDLDFLDDEPF